MLRPVVQVSRSPSPTLGPGVAQSRRAASETRRTRTIAPPVATCSHPILVGRQTWTEVIALLFNDGAGRTSPMMVWRQDRLMSVTFSSVYCVFFQCRQPLQQLQLVQLDVARSVDQPSLIDRN